MQLRNGQFQQQTLKAAMTQELSQAIALLQYTSQELSAFLEARAVENPLVVLESEDRGAVLDLYKGIRSRRVQRENAAENWLEQIGDRTVTLDRYLQIQLSIYKFTEKERRVLNYLSMSLDSNGYFRSSIDEAARITGADPELVESCFQTLQKLEPAGVGARNLQECLLLQIEREGQDALSAKIVKDEFLLFAEKKWKELSRRLNVPLKKIQEVQDYIQTLNPRPGASFHSELPAYAVPDVIVDEELRVSLAHNHSSSWRLNEPYYSSLKGYGDRSLDHYIKEKWQEFQWISRSLKQRRETILKVTELIVEKQPQCFRKGLASLKPMTMKEVSEELGIHESTVSRTVRDKYVQAPFGTIELRAFFTSNLQSETSEEVSAAAVKKEIQMLVQKEDKTKPLSDQEISDILKMESGIILSRRTVAKYRDQLDIPSSSKRKRYI
ncbi:RNA polymerase factor sigma-54 [Peribacillus kribbensis]|uniref:RNA polymerase factor sigma-54 n=1 Tax=Peribacillus kribbensis TaxID=356658 RepID=UPI0003F60EB4|nr:RNA polymerase factor sigma-54 [Peribacillus kribbensis]